MLYFIEQGLMPKTGKRYEWEVGERSRACRSSRRSRTSTGPTRCCTRRSAAVVRERDALALEALRYGDRCWTRVLVDWDRWRADGLTAHENWWPGVYRAFCASRGETPDPQVEAFHVSYKTSRADLKPVAE